MINGVLIGHEGFLFLGQGAHRVTDMATGKIKVTRAALNIFKQNLECRSGWCEANNVQFIHVVFPDKQTVRPDLWPLPTLVSIAQEYLSFVPTLHKYLEFPLKQLQQTAVRSISKVDTHYEIAGQVLAAASLVERILQKSQSEKVDALLANVTKEITVTGDLGSKLVPASTDKSLVFSKVWPHSYYSNRISGNNGIIDIRVSPSAESSKRILVMGDSFCRDTAFQLSYWFNEVMFIRSGFFHPEIAQFFRPDVLITGQIERYLDNPISDDEAPWFFAYPALNRANYSSDPKFQSALTAMLRYPGKKYRQFIENANQST
jgi:hypothetical protein